MREIINREFNKTHLFFNCGSVGPMPQSSYYLMKKLFKQQMENPTGNESEQNIIETYFNTKREMASFLKVKETELAYTQSTSVGIANILAALEWHPEDEIIIGENEYIDALLPFYALKNRYGVKLKRVSMDHLLSHKADYLTEQVKMVFFSHVEYNTGKIYDVDSICRQIKAYKDVLIMVDGAQAVGHIKVTIPRTIDFYSFPCYKWLLGPAGTAMIYIKEANLGQLKPIQVCALGGEIKEENLTMSLSGRRMENASFDDLSFAVVRNNISLFKMMGMEKVVKHNFSLSKRLVDLIANQFKQSYCSGGMVFILLEDKEEMENLFLKLKESGIGVRTLEDKVAIRICFHIYNTEEEVGYLAEVLNSMRKKELVV